jgi:citrate lyase subunit beta / citryl-CoA lyase
MTLRWRSMLFVPGSRPDLAAKATRSAPDVVVLDLEDAVPAAAKVEARAAVREAAAALVDGTAVCVRVNPPDSSWFADDVAALPDGLAGVVVPKLASADQVDHVARALDGRPIIAGIETVRGVADAREVLRAPVIACYFGAEDYIADLGGVRTATNAEVAVPRALVGMAARLAGIPALDMVTLDFGDDDRFVAEARDARALGYAGKLCIHPAQVGLAATAFHPTDDELDWGRRLLAAFDGAGGATIAFEGLMVDEVVAARARALVAAADEA